MKQHEKRALAGDVIGDARSIRRHGTLRIHRVVLQYVMMSNMAYRPSGQIARPAFWAVA
jgi:hypothetical protein